MSYEMFVHVYTGSDSSIWLLDLSLSWHYICPSFSDFLRLAVIHLGLLQWPYALTPYGVSPHYEVSFDTTSLVSRRMLKSEDRLVLWVK